MSDRYTSSIVGIRNSDGDIVGTGFFFDLEGGRLFTCAHIVQAAQLWPGSTARIHIAADSSGDYTAELLLEGWSPPEENNIALLRVRGPLPGAARAVKLGPTADISGRPLHSCGYPRRNELSMWTVGQIDDRILNPRGGTLLRLVAPGMATLGGAPLLDREGDRVVGMITRPPADPTLLTSDAAYAVPAEELARAGVAPLVPRERGRVVRDAFDALGQLMDNPQTRNAVYEQMARPGLSGQMYRRLYDLCVYSGYFKSQEKLLTLFSDSRINLWHDGVPDAATTADRVDALISYLLDRYHESGESGLVLFVRVLGERMPQGDLTRRDLLEMSGLLARELAEARQPDGSGSIDAPAGDMKPEQTEPRQQIIIQGDYYAVDQVSGSAVSIGRESAASASGTVAPAESPESLLDQEMVQVLRRDVTDASEHIDRVSYHKTVHDKLHALQFQCFDLLQSESRYFPDERSLPLCRIYSHTLRTILSDLEAASENATQPLAWLELLREASTILEEALDKRDKDLLDDALFILDTEILMQQPSVVNNRLNEAARGLHLDKLLEHMHAIRRALLAISDDSQRLGELREGIDALVEISQRLLELVEHHDEWQKADVDMRMIEQTFIRPPSGQNVTVNVIRLERHWSRFSQRTMVLYRDRPEAWAVKLVKIGDRVGQAISQEDHESIRDSFESYRMEAGDRFYKVDKELLTVCNELRDVADPLRNLLEKL